MSRKENCSQLPDVFVYVDVTLFVNSLWLLCNLAKVQLGYPAAINNPPILVAFNNKDVFLTHNLC